MDIKIREKLLRERNASIEIANVEPRPRPPSECSSISSVNTRGSRETVMSMNEDRICKSPKKSPKKVNLAVVKQRKKEQGNLELLKTLDEYVRFLFSIICLFVLFLFCVFCGGFSISSIFFNLDIFSISSIFSILYFWPFFLMSNFRNEKIID